MSEELHSANPGKQLAPTADGVDYQRIPVKTHLITNKDDYADVVVKYAKDKMQDGDILFCSEKSVACTQDRVRRCRSPRSCTPCWAEPGPAGVSKVRA